MRKSLLIICVGLLAVVGASQSYAGNANGGGGMSPLEKCEAKCTKKYKNCTASLHRCKYELTECRKVCMRYW
jgi:hypothetical protein